MPFGLLSTLGIGHPWLRRITALLVASPLLLSFVQYLATLPHKRLIDLYIRYVAAQVLAARGNIYSFVELRRMADAIGSVDYGTAFSDLLLAYTHPPSDTVLDLGWTVLAYPDARALYLIVSGLQYAAILVMLWATLRTMGARPLHWVWPALLFAVFVPARASLGLGQSDITILFMMTLSFWAASQGRDLLSGTALAIAILTKVTPGLMLVYWVWKREWRIILFTGIATAALLLLSLPAIGLPLWGQFLFQVLPAISTGTSYFQNQSLPGLINRILLDPKFAMGLQSAPSVPIVRLFTLAAEAAVITMALFFTRGRLVARASFALAIDYAIWVTVLLVISPITWDHYFTWVVLPATVLLAVIAHGGMSQVRRGILSAGLAAALWLVNIPITGVANAPTWSSAPLLYGALLLLGLLGGARITLGERVGEAQRARASILLEPVGGIDA